MHELRASAGEFKRVAEFKIAIDSRGGDDQRVGHEVIIDDHPNV